MRLLLAATGGDSITGKVLEDTTHAVGSSLGSPLFDCHVWALQMNHGKLNYVTLHQESLLAAGT